MLLYDGAVVERLPFVPSSLKPSLLASIAPFKSLLKSLGGLLSETAKT